MESQRCTIDEYRGMAKLCKKRAAKRMKKRLKEIEQEKKDIEQVMQEFGLGSKDYVYINIHTDTNSESENEELKPVINNIKTQNKEEIKSFTASQHIVKIDDNGQPSITLHMIDNKTFCERERTSVSSSDYKSGVSFHREPCNYRELNFYAVVPDNSGPEQVAKSIFGTIVSNLIPKVVDMFKFDDIAFE